METIRVLFVGLALLVGGGLAVMLPIGVIWSIGNAVALRITRQHGSLPLAWFFFVLISGLIALAVGQSVDISHRTSGDVSFWVFFYFTALAAVPGLFLALWTLMAGFGKAVDSFTGLIAGGGGK